MDKIKLLASCLMDWTLDSETEFLESANLDKEMESKIYGYGLQYPNPDLAFFKTRYLKLNVANKNGIRAYEQEVKQGLPTIRGKQINFDHKGKHFICGWLLDGKIEDDHMVVYGAFFKSAFKEDFQTIKELFKKKKLFVSFEIHRYDEEGKEVLSSIGDGTYKITDIVFSGCGLLVKEKPAHPTAQVLKLLASENILLQVEKIAEDYAKKLDDSIIYAEMFMGGEKMSKELFESYEVIVALDEDLEMDDKFEEQLIAEIEGEDLINDDGEIIEAKKITYQQRKGLKDTDFAVIVYVKNKKTGGKRKIRMYPIQDEAHVRNALARLGQEKPQATLKKLGVSVEKVRQKILRRAKQLNMTTLLERYKSSVDEIEKEDKAVAEKVEEKIEDVKAEEKKEDKVEDKKEEKIESENKVEDKKNEEIENKDKKEDVEAKDKKIDEGSESHKAEVKVEETKIEDKKEEEVKVEEEKKEDKVEAKTKTIIEEVITTVREEDYRPDGNVDTKVDVKGTIKRTTTYSDGSTAVTEENIDNVNTYIYEKVKSSIEVDLKKVEDSYKESVESLKKTHQETIEAKDKEIKDLKTQIVEKDEKLKSAKKPDFVIASRNGEPVDSSFSHIRKVIDNKAYNLDRREKKEDKTE